MGGRRGGQLLGLVPEHLWKQKYWCHSIYESRELMPPYWWKQRIDAKVLMESEMGSRERRWAVEVGTHCPMAWGCPTERHYLRVSCPYLLVLPSSWSFTATHQLTSTASQVDAINCQPEVLASTSNQWLPIIANRWLPAAFSINCLLTIAIFMWVICCANF